MIVVSFYTPRFERYKDCDYDQLLMLLDKSCQKLGLEHLVISDEPRPEPLNTFLTYLPENLMQAFLYGQGKVLVEIEQPVLFVGADCLLTRDPTPFFNKDLAITTSDTFSDCKMNTGAIFVNKPLKCAFLWAQALKFEPKEWGDDQICLYRAIKESNLHCPPELYMNYQMDLYIEELRCEDHNWAPNDINDSAGMPTVVHFRGNRKSFMPQWAKKYLNIEI